MVLSRPVEYLSDASRAVLSSLAKDERVLDDDFVSTFTPFSSGDGNAPPTFPDDAIVGMRTEIAKALDKLDGTVDEVLKERKQTEVSAMMWIKIGGSVIVLLVVAAVVAPFITDQQVLASVFSTLSVGGLLLLLYSPVRETVTIANDRSNLMLMVQGFRLRFAAANSVVDLQELASELTAALQFRNRGAGE